MRSSSSWQMDSPSPAPPYLRVVEVSAWVNDWNSRFSWSSAMPMPESSTVKRIPASASVPASSTASRTCPSSVNLKALPSRFVSTWVMRIESPRSSAGTAGSRVQLNRELLAVGHRSPPTPRCRGRSWRTLNGATSRSSLPASRRETSRMSLTRRRSRFPDRWMISTRWCSWGSRSPSASISVAPSTLVSGVRTSWLMLARNSDFAALASSAATRVRSSSRRISLLSVMSSATPCTPTTWSWTMTGTAVRLISMT